MHQSLTGSSIYSSGRAPQRTTTTGSTPIVCIALFQLRKTLDSAISALSIRIIGDVHCLHITDSKL